VSQEHKNQPAPLTLKQVLDQAREGILRDGEHAPTVIADGSRGAVSLALPELGDTHDERRFQMFAAGFMLGHSVSDNFSKLVECWREKKLAIITYRRLNAVQPVEIRVAPYWFEPAVWTDGFYVIAGVEQHGGDYFALTLKLERIQSVQATASTFYPPPIDQLTARIAETWGIWQGEDAPVRITLRFHNRQYDRLRETRWHPSEKITLEPDGAVIWQGYVSEPQEMLPWIRSWGADVEVLEPDHIREQIAAEAEQTARLYDTTPTDDSRASRYF
jgi:predicted DNA-binding transcriptional regulator YafY